MDAQPAPVDDPIATTPPRRSLVGFSIAAVVYAIWVALLIALARY